MSGSDNFENDLALLLYNNVDIAGIGDTSGIRGSATPGNFFIGLHTADPGEAGVQTTNECSYSGYSRVATPRTLSGFSVINNTVSNAAVIRFGTNASGTTVVITHCSIGYAESGATKIISSGALSSPFTCPPGIAPEFAIGQLQTIID